MNEKIKEKCDLLAENYQITQNSAKLDHAQAAALGALIYTSQNEKAAEEDIRSSRKLLHSKTSGFSSLNGYTNLALLCKMSLADDAEVYLDKVIAAYDHLKRGIFHSEYEALAAVCIADSADPSRYEEIGEKTVDIMNRMSKIHPLLTGASDTSVAAMLALTDYDIDEKLAEAEECYELVNKGKFTLSKDALQSVSMILALSSGSVQEKCERFNSLRNALSKTKSEISGEQLPMLAVFAGTEGEPEQIAADIDEACRYLKDKSGFGNWFGVGYKMRVTLAAAVVLQAYQEASGTAGAGNTVASVITQQIVLDIVMLMVASASAAAASAAARK